MSNTQVSFFMRPERLASLLEEILDGWSGTVAVEPPKVLPLQYVVVELSQLRRYIELHRPEVIMLSVIGAPKNETDRRYIDRTPGSHMRIWLGRVDEERRYIGVSSASVDRAKEPALGLLRQLREAIRGISKRGVRTFLASGEVKIKRDLFWTPDLRDWSLAKYQAVDDEDASTKKEPK